MIGRILKYALIIAAVAVVGYAGLTIYQGINQAEAAKMSGSVQLAENQAVNMNRALGDVSALASGNSGVGAAEAGSQPASPEIANITSIDMLIERWEPRYDDAKLAYVKFEAAINNAKVSAAGYFETQQALTESINDPATKAQARQDDERDMALYRQWETQAESSLAKARAIGLQLDDMDASLRKLQLRSDFVFDAESFQAVPLAVSELSAELDEFRAASESIRLATASPFEAK